MTCPEQQLGIRWLTPIAWGRGRARRLLFVATVGLPGKFCCEPKLNAAVRLVSMCSIAIRDMPLMHHTSTNSIAARSVWPVEHGWPPVLGAFPWSDAVPLGHTHHQDSQSF